MKNGQKTEKNREFLLMNKEKKSGKYAGNRELHQKIGDSRFFTPRWEVYQYLIQKYKLMEDFRVRNEENEILF